MDSLTKYEQEVCHTVRKKLLSPLQDFTVVDMFPQVKRGRHVFDSLERKGFLSSSWQTEEKQYQFTDKAKEILGEQW